VSHCIPVRTVACKAEDPNWSNFIECLSCRSLFCVSGIGRARCTRARADQGIFGALVKKTNSRGIEALFVDFEIRTRKGLRRQNLHGELDGVSRAFKSPVTERFAFRPRGPGGEQLSFVIVVECNHFLIQLQGNTSCRRTPGHSASNARHASELTIHRQAK